VKEDAFWLRLYVVDTNKPDEISVIVRITAGNI
jgi:hypothetical protein